MNKENKELQYAGFWIRSFAYFIDVIIVCAMLLVPIILIATLIPHHPEKPSGDLVGTFTLMIINYIWVLTIFLFSYYVLLNISSLQGTLGKRILGLKVVDAQGNKISFLKSLGRCIAFYMILSFTFFLGFLTIPFTKKKRGLHDMLVGTFVVKR